MLLGRRRLRVLLVTAAASALLLTIVQAGSAAAAPGTWLSRINAYRAAYGRVRLAEDLQASLVAQSWTRQVAATGRVSHNPLYRTQVTTPWYLIGENVGYGSSEATVFQIFASSSGHQANLLRPEFNRVGIGQVVVKGRLWTTHIFLATRLPTVAPRA